ncbi:MAG: nucleotidyltransferase substrate binding protein [Pseudomonadota bacterium]
MTTEPLLAASRDKLLAALELLFASVDDYPGFDPTLPYTPKEREPFDALSDRYLRAFESSLKFFKTWERVREAAPSETFRDLLLRMAKIGLITDLETWLNMRDIRNRIAHEYLPTELAHIYAGIVETAAVELRRLADKTSQIR